MPTTDNDVLIVPISPGTAEVRLSLGRKAVSIGKVTLRNGHWLWQHRDGEQSSPTAENRTEAAAALASYHTTFKSPPSPPAPHRPAPTGPGTQVRRLLFA